MYVTNVCNLSCGIMLLFATNWMYIMKHLHPSLQVMFDFCRSMKHSISVDFSMDWGTYAMLCLICDENWILKEDFFVNLSYIKMSCHCVGDIKSSFKKWLEVSEISSHQCFCYRNGTSGIWIISKSLLSFVSEMPS